MIRAALLVCLAVAAFAAETPQNLDCHLNSTAYPFPSNQNLPFYTLDLSQPPKERWASIVKPYGPGMIKIVDQLIKQLPVGHNLTKFIEEFLADHGETALSRMPQEYADEIRGISAAANVPLGYAAAFNIAYELTGVGCTSIVTEDADGSIWHARNLDFGLMSGWDWTNHTWPLTEMLRPMMYNVKVVNGEKFMYNATGFGGFIGLLSGSNGRFSITVDSRFDDKFDSVLAEWLLGHFKGLELTQLTREAIVNNATYADAVDFMTNAKIIGPAYMIVAGLKKGEGAVISREPAKAVDVWNLADVDKAGGFYLLETNYDHWKKAPFYDNRRTPAEHCMNQTTAAGVTKKQMFDILSSKPTINLLTTYSMVMNPAKSEYEAYEQTCSPPCSLW